MASTDINLSNQVFDTVFHPRSSTLYAALLTGDIKAFNYTLPDLFDLGPDDADEPELAPFTYEEAFALRPTKRSCRGLALDEAGEKLFAVGKEKALHVIDTATGKVISVTPDAHDSPINRIAYLNSASLVTGDDEGVIKLWDPRVKPSPVPLRSYSHHWDYITDFLYLEDKKQLVSTSGDATLSVIDIRSSKAKPLSVSESQDDELLSVVSIKGGTKALTGSSLGILSVWDRQKGWGDCVDRIPGHPHSIETIVPLSDDIVATGSSDGMVRIVSILPSKLMGVITHHNDFPIERLALSHDKAALASASHDECVRLTDIRDIMDEDSDDEEDGSGDSSDSDSDVEAEGAPAAAPEDVEMSESEAQEIADEEDAQEEEMAAPAPVMEEKRKKKKKEKNSGLSQDAQERSSFFGGL